MAIRDFKQIKGVDFTAPAAILSSSGRAINQGVAGLQDAIKQQQQRVARQEAQQVNANDLAIQANLEKFKTLSDLKQAQEEGTFGLTARQEQYGDKYTQDKANAALEARKALLSGNLVNDRISGALDAAWGNKGMSSDIQNAAIKDLPLDLRNKVNQGVQTAWNQRTQLTDKQKQKIQDKAKLDSFGRQSLDRQLSADVDRYKGALANIPTLAAENVNWGTTKKGDLDSVISTMRKDPDRSWMRRFFAGDSPEDVDRFKEDLVKQLGGDRNLASAALMQAYSDSREVSRAPGALGGGTLIDAEDLRRRVKEYATNWDRQNKLKTLLSDAQNKRAEELLKYDVSKQKEQSAFRDNFTFGSPQAVTTLEQTPIQPNAQTTNVDQVQQVVDPIQARLAAAQNQITEEDIPAQEQKEQTNALRQYLTNQVREVNKISPPAPTGAVPSPSELRAIDNLKGRVKIKAGTLADKNNNPGNLRLAGQAGAVEGQGGFARFASPAEGYQALVNDLKSKQTGKTRTGLNGDSTLSELINVYAPNSENNTSQYVKDISKWLKIPATTKISEINMDDLAKLIARKESNTKIN